MPAFDVIVAPGGHHEDAPAWWRPDAAADPRFGDVVYELFQWGGGGFAVNILDLPSSKEPASNGTRIPWSSLQERVGEEHPTIFGKRVFGWRWRDGSRMVINDRMILLN